MSKPPPPPKPKSAALLSAIEERDELLVQIKAMQEREMALRKYIAAQLFPNPKEGGKPLHTRRHRRQADAEVLLQGAGAGVP